VLDKSEYYHGVAIIRLLEDNRCTSIKKRGNLGYVINDNIFVLLKYTTKARTPWGFTFDQEDIDRCNAMNKEHSQLVVGLTCGGDGVCAVTWSEMLYMLDRQPGRIAVGRKHDQSYRIWGKGGKISNMVPVKRWPSIMFENLFER
jgi:hypothetical protein